MSYKVSVKQFSPAEAQIPLHNKLDAENSQSLLSKRPPNSVNQQQAVRRYICKLLKNKKNKKATDRLTASERSTSLQSLSNIFHSSLASPLNNESPMKTKYHQILRTDTPDLKYLVPEPTTITKKHNQLSIKNVNLDRTYFKRKIFDPKAMNMTEIPPQDKRRIPRQLNLNKVLQKYHNKIAAEAAKQNFQSLHIQEAKEKGQSWASTMRHIKNKITKAKNHQKQSQIHISQLDANSIPILEKERKNRKDFLSKAKRVTKQQLSKLRQRQKMEFEQGWGKKNDYDPWSTQNIRLSDVIQIQNE